MPKNDIEAFEYVLADKDTPLEIDYLTYAMFAYKKLQWIDHYKKNNDDNIPSQQEVDTWISQLSEYDFYQMRNEAADFFRLAARELLKDEIEEEKKTAVGESILGEVKSIKSEVESFTSPWKHLGIALLMAIIAPVFFGGLVFFWSLFDRSFPIHVTIGALVEQPASQPK